MCVGVCVWVCLYCLQIGICTFNIMDTDRLDKTLYLYLWCFKQPFVVHLQKRYNSAISGMMLGHICCRLSWFSCIDYHLFKLSEIELGVYMCTLICTHVLTRTPTHAVDLQVFCTWLNHIKCASYVAKFIRCIKIL